jgi:hypothetical protein
MIEVRQTIEFSDWLQRLRDIRRYRKDNNAEDDTI